VGPPASKGDLIGVTGSLQAQDLGAGEIRAAGRVRQGNSVWEYVKLLMGKCAVLLITVPSADYRTFQRRPAVSLRPSPGLRVPQLISVIPKQGCLIREAPRAFVFSLQPDTVMLKGIHV
jgi:hypothetical protein